MSSHPSGGSIHLQSSCVPYPKDLKSLEECCDVPIIFSDNLLSTCEHMCAHDKKDKDDPDCPMYCLFINNNIMRNGVINKTAIEDFLDQHGYGDPNWRPITKKGIDKCDIVYDKTKSFRDAFEKFEDCLNINYEEHCINFKEPLECDKVEEFMVKCQNIKHDCTVWPKWIVKLPEHCCGGRPELFSKEFTSKANEYCKKQDLVSKAGTMQCLATFLVNTTGIKTNGKWDFTIATKFLTENSKNNAKWKTAIEKTVEACEKQVQGLINQNFM